LILLKVKYLISLPLSEVRPSSRQNEAGVLWEKDATVSLGMALLTVLTAELNQSYSPNCGTP